MDNETLFYGTGIVLAVSAVLFSFAALRMDRLPSRAAPVIFIWFAVFVGAAATFSVLHAKDEEKHKEAELHEATEEAEKAANEGTEAAP